MPEPLAALDGNGKATVISYDVPEPISYSGRNFLQVPLPDEAFTTVVLTSGSAPNPSAADQPDPPDGSARLLTHASILAPDGVVVQAGEPGASPILRSPRPLSERLGALTNADLGALVATGRQVVLFPDVAGRLDFRVADPMMQPIGGGGSLPDPTFPGVRIFLGSPTNNTTLHGTAAGLTLTASGTWHVEDAAVTSMTLTLDDGAPVQIDRQGNGVWSTPVTITSAGSHTITAAISASGFSSGQKKRITVNDRASVTIEVILDPEDPEPPPLLPTVTIDSPVDNTTLVNPGGLAPVTVRGRASCDPRAVLQSVTVTDEATGSSVTTDPVGEDLTQWSVELLLSGLGRHRLTVVATDDHGHVSAPQSVLVLLSERQAFRRLKNRLMLVETLNLSSFLGAFGAGRVIKTFSLLPGEKTTISVRSWTKSADSRKNASSIVDSDATEAATDFEDTLSAEQTSREAQTEAANYKVGASASATWGWGSASINAEFSGSANSARDDAVKNISSATRKHAMKASSNRNVTINTEYAATQEEGSEDSTTREIANLNVSRTLNFVFRQMNQQHIILIHLTAVRVAYYTEDLMLDPSGNPATVQDPVSGETVLDIRPSYTEVSLPQLQGLLREAITTAWQPKVLDAISFALSGIPDYQDHLHTGFEQVVPTRDGEPVEGATYLRFRRDLSTDFEDPVSKQHITVPGIVLASDHIVMRTEGVMVDTVLGQGDGLDAYSHGLQDAAVAERQLTMAERQAQLDRLALAREIIRAKDKDAAAIFATVFPPDREDAHVG